MWTCRRHGLLPRAAFHKSSITHRTKECKECISRRNAAYFAAAKSVFVASEVRARERARTGEKEFCFSAKDAEEVLLAFGNVCFLTGASHPLTIVRAFADRPLGVSNAVPVKRSIARLIGGVLPEEYRSRWLAQLGCVGEEEMGEVRCGGQESHEQTVVVWLDAPGVVACC